MDRADRIYRGLQQHLDRQAVGYPATRSGAEIRILKRLFSPEEAELAMHLTYKPTSIERIHESARGSGVTFQQVETMLTNMAKNGAIGLIEREGTRQFHTLPFIVGMFEGQLKRLTPEFLTDVQQYTSDKAFGLAFLGTELPQMRTIPVGKSIPVEHLAATYDDIVRIIRAAAGPFAVMECICRRAASLKGNPCRMTSRSETCMAFGDTAKNAVQGGSGRAIGREEAIAIAGMNQADALVLQPSNTRKVDFVCACCGCCCGMLRMHKTLPKPVDFWASNYHAAADTETCSGCGTCVKRCQVDALSVEDGARAAVVNLNRCIGCGNCVVACPTGAMRLRTKDGQVVPPEDSENLYSVIMAKKKGTMGKLALAMKLMLKR